MTMKKWKQGKMIKSMEQYENSKATIFIVNGKAYHTGWIESWQYRMLRDAIRNGRVYEAVPTIDAVPMDDYMDLHNHFVDWEPIRHGKWVVTGKTTHYYICSVCGEPGDGWDNYCRSCGSRMEQEADDEID